jgi:hypothetical protein
MKVFIVFLGLMLVNTCLLSYKSDYGKYIYLHRALDNIAFECAEMAAYGADENEARIFANGFLEYTVRNLKDIKVRDYTFDIYYEDGFAVAYIRMDVENLFRFPLPSETSIIAQRKIIEGKKLSAFADLEKR